MRQAALIPALLIAASASAQTASLSLTLTSANGGADTLATWNYTGTPTLGPEGDLAGVSVVYSGLLFAAGNYSAFSISVSGDAYFPFETDLPSVTGLNTGLVLTNTTNNTSVSITKASFLFNGTLARVLLGFDGLPFGANPGQVLVLSGPTTGSFLTGIAYSNFREGTWTLDQLTLQNYDPVLTFGGAGAPIPEPSTYGLALGGLALVGAVIRRRRKA